MLGLTFFDLIPEALETVDFGTINICFFAGVAFFALVVKVFPESSFEDAFLGTDGAGAKKKKGAQKHSAKNKKVGRIFSVSRNSHCIASFIAGAHSVVLPRRSFCQA